MIDLPSADLASLADALLAVSPAITLLCLPEHDDAGTVIDFTVVRWNAAAQQVLQLPKLEETRNQPQSASLLSPAGKVHLLRAYADPLAVEPLRLWCNTTAGPPAMFRVTCRRVADILLLRLDPEDVMPAEKYSVEQDSVSRNSLPEPVSHQQLQQVLELAPVAVASLAGPDHVFTFLNPAYAQLLGGRPVLGLPVRQALPDLNNQAFPGLLDRVYQTGEPYVGHEMLVQYDRTFTGRVEDTYFNFLYQATRDASGRITGVILFAYDVTDAVFTRLQTQRLNAELHQVNQDLEVRVQTRTWELEQARAEAEAHSRQLADLFAQAPVAICVFRGPAFVVEVVNPSMSAMLGRAPEQLLGRPFAEALPELAQQGLPAVLAQVRQTGRPYVAQEQEIHLDRLGDGAPGYFTFTYQPLRDEHDHVTAVACVAVEVTGLVMAHRVAERDEQRLRRLMEATPMVVWEADAQGQTTYLSPRWEQFTTAANGHGLGWQQYVHPDDQQPFLDAWLAAVAQGEPFQAALRLCVAATGQYRWHLDRAVPVRDAGGQLLHWVGAALDIHEQKLAEQELLDVAGQLRRANAQLTRTNTDLDNFIYTASHDLKAPIANIEGLLQVVREETATGA